MSGYRHFIRIDAKGIVIHGFTDAFEQLHDGDILILEDGPRHFQLGWPEPLINDRGQYRFKWDGTQMVERSQDELDAEWAARPPAPETDQEKIARLEAENTTLKERQRQMDGDFAAFVNQYYLDNPDKA